MTNFIKTQNSFVYGEISPEFFAHDDMCGLSVLENMDVTPGGGITRRKGLTPIADIGENARLISFSVSENDDYLLVLCDEKLQIYKDGNLVQNIATPWSFEAIKILQYAQRFATMIFVHPNYPPQVLEKTSSGFALKQFSFDFNENGWLSVPRMQFDDANGVTITITSSAMGNTFGTLTTNKNFWTPDSETSRIYIAGKEWIIRQYDSPTQVTAFLGETFISPIGPVSDWLESAFSVRRGWPSAIAFHQDRLVFGGTPSRPSGLWMSCVGKHGSFEAGTGLDDEAISVTLLSQERQQICTIVSSDNLQILTNSGEWAISSKPLTPTNIDIKQHTSVGSVVDTYLAPQQIEGKTIFVSANQQDIRELALDDLGVKYNANDLCIFSKHLMGGIDDIAYNQNMRQLFLVRFDGTLSVLNYYSNLEISAWAKYTTIGEFKSVAVVGGDTYVVIKRDEVYALEMFSKDVLTDGSGLSIVCQASGIPLRASNHECIKWRTRKIAVRVMNTKTIFINGARVTLPDDIYLPTKPGFNGDVCINQLGTESDYTKPLWHIHTNEPLPINVLSVSVYGRYTI